MSRLKTRRFKGLIVTAVCGLALLVACSTDSPTAPFQVPPPPTDDGGPDIWSITVSASPSVLIASDTQPTTITVQIRNSATGANPEPGSTLELSTTIGEFDFAGSEALVTAAVIDLGRASALLFPSSFAGTATITAIYGGSRGSTTVRIGTGEAFITEVSPNNGPEAGGTSVTVSGVGFFAPLRVRFGNYYGDVSSSASDGTSVRVKTPPFSGTFLTEDCTKNSVAGKRNIATPVTVTVETPAGTSPSLSNGFFYNPSDKSCDTG